MDILLRSLTNIRQDVNVVRRKVVEAAFNSDWQEFFPNDHGMPTTTLNFQEDDIRRNQEEVDVGERNQSQDGGHPPNQNKLASFSQFFLHSNEAEKAEGSSRYLTILQPPVRYHQEQEEEEDGAYTKTVLAQSRNDLGPERYLYTEPCNRYNSESRHTDFHQMEQVNEHGRQYGSPSYLSSYRALQPHNIHTIHPKSPTGQRESIKDFRQKSPMVRNVLQVYNCKPREGDWTRNDREPKRRRLRRQVKVDSKITSFPGSNLNPTSPLPSSSFTSLSTSPSRSTFPTLYAKIPMSLLPKKPLLPSSLPQHLLPPSLCSTSPLPASPSSSSFLSPASTTAPAYTSSSNYSSSPYFSPRSSTTSPAPIASPTSSPVPSPTSLVGATICSHCGTSQTSLWRRDNNGWPLCNACKLYHKVKAIKLKKCDANLKLPG